jgi:hypothetical protein
MIFLAERLRDRSATAWKPLVLMGSEVPFPFRARPSSIMIPGMPEAVIASHAAAGGMGHALETGDAVGLCRML